MKKVALISDGWKRLIIYAWTDGIMNKIKEYSEEVCLYHYNCYGNWSSEEMHNRGEYNIFNLPDLRQFDGIILDCNNITDQEQLNYVIGLIKSSGVPAVSIARDIDGFYYAGIDNKKPINTMMDHLYDRHGCRSFAFAGGPEGNYENDCRVKAYTDSIKRFGLKVEENPVFYGDYDYETGVRFFNQLIDERRKLPDAILCACDNIATGVCTQAEKMGYKVPEDFRVTGFDNLDKAAYFRPQIATVDHNRGHITYRCMETLIDIWEGRQPEKYNFIETECVYGESCGCPNNGKVDYREYMKGQIIYGIQKAKEDERISELESNMSKCTRFSEMYECMNHFISGYDCEGFFVVVDDAFTTAKPRTCLTTKGYNTKNMSVVYACDKGEKLEFSKVEDLYAYIEKTGGKSEYLFTPIHFKQYAIGYTILKNGRFLYYNPYFYDLHNILVKELESLYSHIKLETVNKKLKDIYNKDQLTGIYNRIAYAETIAPEFKRYYEENIVCALGFVDVDNFKQINDTYGHEYGDEVLKKVAAILQKQCPKNGYACRYGGDEFIIFFPNADKESAAAVKKAINEAAAAIDIKLSIGMVLSTEKCGSDIKDYFEIADKYMYEEKMLHKKASQ